MSLDVYLSRKKWISYDEGKTHEIDYEQVYEANITHNLGKMAHEAGIYKALWRPEEIKAVYAKDIIGKLKIGLGKLKKFPKYYERFNAVNGWGLYKHFVPFVEKYLNACMENPEAEIEISR